jgi:hypothetical protein
VIEDVVEQSNWNSELREVEGFLGLLDAVAPASFDKDAFGVPLWNVNEGSLKLGRETER